MKDPRQEAYRAECAAEAGRGVSRLDWVKPSFLFISNLNHNVTEQLLRVELAKWCPPSKVTIPTFDGHPLGLAQAKFPHGVILDRLLKEFNQEEFHGQRVNIVVDHEAKKYRQALTEANHQANMKSSHDPSSPSPKKRMRAPESPTYSPASPARPVSDSDGPSPSKPKRPRCNSPPTSRQHHPDDRAHGDRMNDTNRNSGERQFSHSRRDAHHKTEPYHRSDSRNFANDAPRDYPGRRHDYHGRHSSAHNYQHRNQPYNGDSRQHRYESTGHNSYYGHRNRHRYGDRYDDHRRRDRRYGSDYRERQRSPRRYDNSYPRDYSYRTNNYPSWNSPKHRDVRQRSSHENGCVGEREWENEYRPAIVLEAVPRGTIAQDLLDAFRDFCPKKAVTDGRGKWTMWFEKTDDRDRAAANHRFFFKGCMLRISASSHLVGRRSVSTENPTSGQREAHHAAGNGTLPASSDHGRRSGSGKEPTRGSDDQYRQRDIQRDTVRRDSQAEHRESGQLPLHRDPNGNFTDRAIAPDSSNDVHPDTSHHQTATWQRMENYSAGQRRRTEKNNQSREYTHRESGRNGAKREQRDDRYSSQGRIATSKTPDVGSTRMDSGGDVKKAGSGSLGTTTTLHDDNRENLPVDKTIPACTQLKDFQNVTNVEPLKQASVEPKPDPKLSSKNLSVEEFADVLACYVYQKAKDTITAKRSAVQKSFVNQTVAKFTNARKASEKERTKRAARALVNNARKASTKNEGSASTAKKTAHLDLVETFLKPAVPKQTKPPLPDRTDEIPKKRRTKRSRFADVSVIESAGRITLDSPKRERKDLQSSDNQPSQSVPKRRRLVLPNSPQSSESEHASADEQRQNSVDSVASSELFHEKESPSKRMKEEQKKREDVPSSLNAIINAEKPHIRHAKASSLKLSAPSVAGGSIPRLVLSARPPPSPAAPGPPGSALTSSEDNTSQEPCSPVKIAKESSQKQKSSGKTKKKASRGKGQHIKKQTDKTSDDEQYADLLLSLNPGVQKTTDRTKIEFLQECGFIGPVDFQDTENLLSKRSLNVSKGAKAPSKGTKRTLQDFPTEKIEPDVIETDQPDTLDLGQVQTEVEEEPEERELPKLVGKCARSDVYVRADHTGQHRQRNVHSRTTTSTQTSRECRQESRVYRKGVSRINPKNDIISFNHLKQRRKQVSFGQSMIHGMGLYAKENIESGEFIIEYVGDLIRKVVADLREKKYTRQGMGDSYLFRLSGDWVIDATRRGGIARFINHSCDPNVYAKIISVVGEPKIVFYSKRSIKEGEELTYDYKFDFEAEDQKIPCLCKAATCRKYLN